MALTADQLATIRAEIGDAEPPTDSDLDDTFTRRGGIVGVVREVWKKRLAALISTPATFAIPGDYSQSTGDNIKAIQDRLKALDGLLDSDDLPVAGGAVLGVGFLHRCVGR